MIAAIDIGTNTIRLAIADENTCKVVLRLSKIARLGKGSNGYLQEENIQKALEILDYYESLMKRYNCADYIAVATSAVREAKNKNAFLDKTHLNIEVIDGLREASLSQKGILFALEYLKKERWAGFDLGGGSCEFIFCDKTHIIESFSVKLGVVKLLEQFCPNDPPTEENLQMVGLQFKKELLKNSLDFECDYLIGNAGTVTSLCAMDLNLTKYDYDKCENYRLSKDSVKRLLEEMISMDRASRLKRYPVLEEGREDVIVVGAKVVLTIMEIFHKDCVYTTNGSLLEGLIVEHFC
jgi:exopolyphosphatase/guanosine-5'-triphosphate,3'-diphosphate pyrophosphatase